MSMTKPTTNIQKCVEQLERAFGEIRGTAAGTGFTLQPHSTRENVAAMTQSYGLSHLHELAEGLAQLGAHAPELFAQLTSSRNVVDLNCGGGLSGLLLAMLAATHGSVPRLVFIDHARAAVNFAVELADQLGIKASGLVVVKHYIGAPPNELPDHNGMLTSANLEPALPKLAGSTTIVAGHALSCHALNRDSKRQDNLALQNKLVLGQVDQALDSTASLVLVDLDIAFHGLTVRDFVSMVRTSDNVSRTRSTSTAFEAWPANQTPGKQGKVKYFAVQQLEALPCVDNLVAWEFGDFEILLAESEVEALIGERASPAHYPDLQRLLTQEVG